MSNTSSTPRPGDGAPDDGQSDDPATTASGDSAPDEAAFESEVGIGYLRSALEFAVTIAREGQKVRPKVPYPPALKRFLGTKHLSAPALVAVRNIVEGDPEFRQRLAAGALPELVDPIGRVWLSRRDGWRTEIDALIIEADNDAHSADAEARARRAEKQREAAQVAAVRAQADLVMSRDRVADLERLVDELRADVAKAADELSAARAELVDARNEIRHSRDRERAAQERWEAAEEARLADEQSRREAEVTRDVVLADRAASLADRAELARLATEAQSLADRLSGLARGDSEAAEQSASSSAARTTRSPLKLPGGVLGDSFAASEYLLRSGASIIIDGYNVAKLAWPGVALIQQRQRLLDGVENVARRFGSDITVVFDGANVVGAVGAGRRLVRVVYSPADVIADDVIRDEVKRLPVGRAVIVVTNDQEIVRDVRAVGANTMSSTQFIEAMR